jgi:cyclohexanecarboxyl-CoA dehydrogenase
MKVFGFTEAQEMLRAEARRFAQKELAPMARERAAMSQPSPEMRQRLCEMGWTGLNAPSRYGGQAIDYVSVGILVEEIAKVDPTLALVPAGMTGMSKVMSMLPEGIQDEWYPKLISGGAWASYGVTEPDTGSDVGSMKTRAVREGDCYIISGEKTPISWGMIAEAMVLVAKTDPDAGIKGMSLFWVPLDLPGISRSPVSWAGQRYEAPGSISFDGVRLPAEYRIGDEGVGFYTTMMFFEYMRVILGVYCLGAAQASLDEAIAWAKQRIAFGRPIAQYEGVSFKIAEQYTMVEAAKLLCYRALWLMDRGRRSIKESSMAKWLGVDVAFRAITEAMMVFGHVGYSEDYPIQQRLRDVMGYKFGDGTDNIQKLVIVRELMGREAVTP